MSVIKEAIVRAGHGPLNPTYFCVHSTANPGATAANHVNYWRNNDVPNAHLVSDWTEAYHTVPYDALCWQVGNGNAYVEGLEICEATNQTDFQNGIELAAQVVRERLDAHGWGIDRLICHDDARQMWGGTDHTDPHPYFSRWGYSWEQFKQLVEGETMPSAQEIADAVWARDLNGVKAIDRLYGLDAIQVPQLTATVTAQQAAIETLANSMGADPGTIANAVTDAVKAKLETLKITVEGTQQ